MDVAALIAALGRPEAYPSPPTAPVTTLQTHISVLFFADERVYKVKKAVDLDFLDYSTLERRRHFCAEEVRLNRRLAPDTYLGVAPIVRVADGSIRIGGDGEAVEYAVEMVRLPQDRLMSAMLERGEIDNGQLDAIVAILVRFHRDAPTGAGVDEFGRAAEMRQQAEKNLGEVGPFVAGAAAGGPPWTLTRPLHDRLRRVALTWLDEHVAAMDERVRDGRIREGHGDLHTGNICLGEEEIVIYDCIEFARRLRCRDVACELGFLAMDLDFRRCRGFAGYLLHRYATITGDADLEDIAWFYKLHLAIVRGKVASIRSVDAGLGDAARQEARLEAMRYFHLAAAYTLPAPLILMCGLPATGKSHAAGALALPFEAVVLRSDVVRKAIAGMAPDERGGGKLDEGIYTAEFTERTYAAVLEHARDHLGQGRPVVVDATFATAAQRGPFLAAARSLGVPCVLVEMTCPEEVVGERLAHRALDATEPSDADLRVYELARTRFEPPGEVPARQRIEADSRRLDEETVAAALDTLIAAT